MNLIRIIKKDRELFTFESSYVPQEGETIWVGDTLTDTESYKVESKVLEFNKRRRRLEISLMVK